MKRTLLFKFSICYIFTICCIFIILNTYGIEKINNMLLDDKKIVLYDEALLISSEYMTNYYSNFTSFSYLKTQLKTIDTFINSRIWIVAKDGTILLDTRSDITSENKINVLNYNEDFLSQTYCEHTYFEDIFTEPMLSVTLPVSIDYEIKGYIVMTYTLSQINKSGIHYMNIINECFLLSMIIFLFVFAFIYYMTVIPVKKILIAISKYNSSDYSYKIELESNDEFKLLSDAINYMGKELSSLDDYQKKFVANISHDFRSPLTSIKGYTEAMLDGTIPVEMQDRYLNIILFEAERLTKLTTNLLTLNSFENGALLDISVFDINNIIKQTAESFEGACTKKKITLNLIFSDKETYVSADMGKIQQVLYNLIDNAVKFSNNDSKIKVSTDIKNDKVFISVKDYGVGIPKENIKKIWERFYKTDTSRGKDKKGTGLGLSITKEIIQAHNENINVTSTEGVGTEFTFSLSKGNIH